MGISINKNTISHDLGAAYSAALGSSTGTFNGYFNNATIISNIKAASGFSPNIGSLTAPFNCIYGNVNKAGTSNAVYGAVFN